jgi:ribosomal protein S18 acetylase RimI-like enzyme
MIEYRLLTEAEQKRAVIEACDEAFSNPVSRRPQYETLLGKIHAYGDFVAAYDREPMGYVAMYANDLQSRTAYVSLLAVRPGCQGMGIGEGLMRAGLNLAKSRGMKAAKLEVKKDNHRAIRLYQRLGFVLLSDAAQDSVYMMNHFDEN